MMLYRSRLTRWVLTLVGLWVGAVILFGDHEKWRTAPSLAWIGRVPVSFAVWGWLFVAYAVLLIPRRTRPIGFLLGAFLIAVFTVSLIATINTEGPKNAIAIGGLVDLTAFHLYAVRVAFAADEAERRPA